MLRRFLVTAFQRNTGLAVLGLIRLLIFVASTAIVFSLVYAVLRPAEPNCMKDAFYFWAAIMLSVFVSAPSLFLGFGLLMGTKSIRWIAPLCDYLVLVGVVVMAIAAPVLIYAALFVSPYLLYCLFEAIDVPRYAAGSLCDPEESDPT